MGVRLCGIVLPAAHEHLFRYFSQEEAGPPIMPGDIILRLIDELLRLMDCFHFPLEIRYFPAGAHDRREKDDGQADQDP